MRRMIVTRMMAVTVMAAASLIAMRPAQAHHHPNFRCSEDICQSARRVDGIRKLGIMLAARYFRVFHLCVTDPDGFE